ncbi:hypothetical protein KIH86_17475 [Paenibacillus sp. HN-1]|uniref:DUF5666 domain-containing protein n=1 Tax=Paenibacillus TaxID=44249 RepID=UPI001CA91D33|nr:MULTISPECIES: DUF5666 domain-containing protein [Paenibacillus]MBY9081841.1 hypothetical protein [Paenibacillus sp. CGMCC 1.18879]MBY9086001.1 hypothetical protein [Paenibacillus sinensis]
MVHRKPLLLWGALLVLTLLTGCGKDEAEAVQQSPAPTPAASAKPYSDSFIGRIDSIAGSELTLTKAADDEVNGGTQSGDSANDVGMLQQGSGAVTGGSASAKSGGRDPAAASATGEAASMNTGNGETGEISEADNNGNSSFTGEQITVTVNDSTEYAGSGSGTEAAFGLADLKAGDIVRVTLTDGTLLAVRIEQLQPQGGGMLPAASPGAAAQATPSATPAATPAAGKGTPPPSGAGGKGAPPAGDKAGGSGTPPSGMPAGGKGGAPGSRGAGGSPPSDTPAGNRAGAGQAASAKPAATAKAAATPAAGAQAATAKPAASPVAAANPGQAPAASPGKAEAPGGANAMSFGKIKSIGDGTITVYTAEAPSAPQGGSAVGGADAAGSPMPLPSGSPPAAGEGQSAAGEGSSAAGGPRGGQPSFTSETVTLTVNASTKLISVTITDGKRAETEITLGDLKAGDVVQYVLKSGSKIADSITLTDTGTGGNNGNN